MAFVWDKNKKRFYDPEKESKEAAKEKALKESQEKFLEKTGQSQPKNPVIERQNGKTKE